MGQTNAKTDDKKQMNLADFDETHEGIPSSHDAFREVEVCHE